MPIPFASTPAPGGDLDEKAQQPPVDTQDRRQWLVELQRFLKDTDSDADTETTLIMGMPREKKITSARSSVSLKPPEQPRCQVNSLMVEAPHISDSQAQSMAKRGP